MNKLITVNNLKISKLLIKTYYATLLFKNGNCTIKFNDPFPNNCICVLINDDGDLINFQTFMIGKVEKEGFMVKTLDKTYSVSDYVKIIAIGY